MVDIENIFGSPKKSGGLEVQKNPADSKSKKIQKNPKKSRNPEKSRVRGFPLEKSPDFKALPVVKGC